MKKNKRIKVGQSRDGQEGLKCPLPKRVAVFPDIELTYEDCRTWTRKNFCKRMPHGSGWEDLCQETLREILEEERAHSELEQTKHLPATTLALRVIHQCGELPDALASAIKVSGAYEALIALLEQPEAQSRLRSLLEAPSVYSDAVALDFATRDMHEFVRGAKGRHALLVILGCGPAQTAVLAMLRQYPLPPILRRILRWWPAFDLCRGNTPRPLVPFVAAFKQTCWGRWADACRRCNPERQGEMTVEAIADHAPVEAWWQRAECQERSSSLYAALRALAPHERLVVCLSYLCDDHPASELGQVLGLARLRIKTQIASDAFIMVNKRWAMGGSIRLNFTSDFLTRSEIKRLIGLTEICIPLGLLRASLSQREVEQMIAGQIKLSFFQDDLSSEEIGQMLGLPSLRVLRWRAIGKMRKLLTELG
jgi:DNA-directed RNA polymerase specialized sigma24 family protein